MVIALKDRDHTNSVTLSQINNSISVVWSINYYIEKRVSIWEAC